MNYTTKLTIQITNKFSASVAEETTRKALLKKTPTFKTNVISKTIIKSISIESGADSRRRNVVQQIAHSHRQECSHLADSCQQAAVGCDANNAAHSRMSAHIRHRFPHLICLHFAVSLQHNGCKLVLHRSIEGCDLEERQEDFI